MTVQQMLENAYRVLAEQKFGTNAPASLGALSENSQPQNIR